MPNWVYNGLTVEGNPESVKKMMEQLNQPFTMIHDSWDVSTNTMLKGTKPAKNDAARRNSAVARVNS